jgi:ArsR family transcriptional regulator
MKRQNEIYIEPTRILKALAHPVRIQLLQRLMKSDCCVSEVEKCLGISQPNVSQHLKLLKEAGIVATSRQKTKICYRIVDERVRDILKLILEGDH